MPDELSTDVAHHFEEEWRNYDDQIRQAIPFYDEALELLVAVLARTAGTPRRILDLGVGTKPRARHAQGAYGSFAEQNGTLQKRLHVPKRLPTLQPTRVPRVLGMSEHLPPPDQLSVESSLRQSEASGESASLDVHQPRIARR
jgi:hypothetical protein